MIKDFKFGRDNVQVIYKKYSIREIQLIVDKALKETKERRLNLEDYIVIVDHLSLLK